MLRKYSAVGKRKQPRKELLLIEMDRVALWKGLIVMIDPHDPRTGAVRKVKILGAIWYQHG